MNTQLIFGLCCVVACLGTSIGNLVLLKDATADGAACLDGTPPAFYFQKGTGSGINKWEIHHEGGGWCTSLADCFGRSKTALGSSLSYGATAGFPFGYFSDNQYVNPLMYNWNKVYLKYCDGASFAGDNNTVADYNGNKLYFRGFKNLNAYFNNLFKVQGLNQATEVVIGGCSAGGLATFLHLDWWRSKFPSSVKVVGLPDSGYFLDYNAVAGPKYSTDMKWVFKQQNATSGVNQGCIQNFTPRGTPEFCFFAEHTAPFIATPIFPLQSQYDSWQTANILGSSDATQINNFGKMLISRFQSSVLPNSRNGVFLDSCFHHCDGYSLRINDVNASQVFSAWYAGGGGVRIQAADYPCTACCSHTH